MANDLPGMGSKFQVKISSTFTDVPGLHDIEWPGRSVAERNPTGNASANVRKKPGMPNLGEIKFKFWFDPNDATHQYIRTKVSTATPNQAQDEVKLIYADGNTTPANANVKGFFKGWEEGGFDPEAGTVSVDCTFAVDTLVAYNAGTP